MNSEAKEHCFVNIYLTLIITLIIWHHRWWRRWWRLSAVLSPALEVLLIDMHAHESQWLYIELILGVLRAVLYGKCISVIVIIGDAHHVFRLSSPLQSQCAWGSYCAHPRNSATHRPVRSHHLNDVLKVWFYGQWDIWASNTDRKEKRESRYLHVQLDNWHFPVP